MTLPICPQGHNMEKQYIENLLSEKMHNRKFKSVQEKICWERGFLTGLLQTILKEDPSLFLRMKRKFK